MRGAPWMLCAISAFVLTAAAQDPRATEGSESPFLDAALDAASWLTEVAYETEHGITWPVVPAESEAAAANLYSGSPGVVLFFLELFRATGDEAHLELAMRGADELIASLPEEPEGLDCGLYTGIAGRGFTLLECWRSSDEERYREAAKRCCDLIHAAARETEHGKTWTDTTDIISGSAGTGLFLLDASLRLGRPQDFELALEAGRHLLELARPKRGGVEWPMNPSFPRRMPNFSHGTAGVGYFLARLFEDSGEEEFLKAAQKAAQYLEDVSDLDAKGLRVFHHSPGGEDLYYYGWCHGPVGTARLFEVLRRASRDQKYALMLRDAGRAVRASGLPGERLEGFWDNVGVCCGSAGVGSFFIELHEALGEPGDLDFAREVMQDMLARATRDEHGLHWVQAEHRSRPELLQAQTGWMQGAAGIGLTLLRAHSQASGGEVGMRLPDDPF